MDKRIYEFINKAIELGGNRDTFNSGDYLVCANALTMASIAENLEETKRLIDCINIRTGNIAESLEKLAGCVGDDGYFAMVFDGGEMTDRVRYLEGLAGISK